MSPPRKRKIPLWGSRLALSQAKLEYILDCLEKIQTTAVTHKLLEFLGIELHDLDLETGTTSASVQQFFKPRDDGQSQISNTPLNPEDGEQDDFTCYRRLRQEGIHVNMGLQTHLASAFKDYAHGLVKAGQPQLQWKPIQQGSQGPERFRSHRRDAFSFFVTYGAQFDRENQCHRHVWIETDDEPDPELPTVAELVVLVSWMLGAMHPQRKLKSTRALNNIQVHHAFPTMVISFQPRARARVLYAYFDGIFKIQMSRYREFDVSDYVTQMDTLLKWAWPKTCGLTTRVLPLPTIVESDEEVVVGGIEKSATPTKPLRGRLKKVISFAAKHFWGDKTVKTVD